MSDMDCACEVLASELGRERAKLESAENALDKAKMEVARAEAEVEQMKPKVKGLEEAITKLKK